MGIEKSQSKLKQNQDQFVNKYNSHVKKVNTFKTAIGSNDGTLANGMIQTNKSKGGILKTIVLPNEDVNRLSL